MKKIEAIIRPEKLDDVKEALNAYGIFGMTVTQVMGCGRQKGRKEVYRGVELNINLLPKIKIEVAANDQDVDKIIDVVSTAARTGQIGDGKIFVYDIENIIRIRTGDTGENAI
ncbi:P-II family nitrogen regulator [Mahella australiensis]|uniref:Nitrogen regulatory protein P-II n=1 Tax=Mahella australiensis (strain DSM 15567 / CIP 107919 / 50-1 BON) TaxID=697281 RepID=F3ZYD7_MAHA5|nr:P-II family nitrogen regulator [Mahella australiensis]AEE96679.1 nitrogen regulatory protein P-II [Mahella australiensis 50-1 BON]